MDKELRNQLVLNYCKEQNIPIHPPAPNSEFPYMLDLADLDGIQFITIRNILDGKEVSINL